MITIEYDMCYMILQYVDGLNSTQVDQTMVLSSSGKSCSILGVWFLLTVKHDKTCKTSAMVL